MFSNYCMLLSVLGLWLVYGFSFVDSYIYKRPSFSLLLSVFLKFLYQGEFPP